MVIAEKKI